MEKKVKVGILRSQKELLKAKLPLKKMGLWVSEAMSDLLLLDRKCGLPASFFRESMGGKKGYLDCLLSEAELFQLGAILLRGRTERKSFSRTSFAINAVARKLEGLVPQIDPKTLDLQVRIYRTQKQKIREEIARASARARSPLVRWVGEAVEVFLDSGRAKNPAAYENCFFWKEAEPTIVKISPEAKLRVQQTVEILRKTNPKFSISLFFEGAVRFRLEERYILPPQKNIL